MTMKARTMENITAAAIGVCGVASTVSFITEHEVVALVTGSVAVVLMFVVEPIVERRMRREDRGV